MFAENGVGLLQSSVLGFVNEWKRSIFSFFLFPTFLSKTILLSFFLFKTFEQSFFLLVHLSYLQAFEDVNKRTSRLSCNIPFIKQNLCPLSFIDVSSDDYTAALLAVYEKNEMSPMLDLFCWAYVQSCKQYSVVKQSLGDIDAFRIQYRQQRKEVIGHVVRNGLHGEAIEIYIEKYCLDKNIVEKDRFTAMTIADLSSLHAGAIIGLGISETQLNVWLDSC